MNADGTVRHLTSEEFLEKGHSARPGKVCFEEKECYEEKECHEDVARQVRGQLQKLRAARPAAAKKARDKRKASPSARVLILIGIIVFFAIVSGAFNMMKTWSFDIKERFDIGWEDIFSSEPEQEPVPADKAWLCYYDLGDAFYWNENLIAVDSMLREGDHLTVVIRCVGDPENWNDENLVVENLSNLPLLQDRATLKCSPCWECGVHGETQTMELGYEIDAEAIGDWELIFDSFPPDGTHQEIHVDIAA